MANAIAVELAMNISRFLEFSSGCSSKANELYKLEGSEIPAAELDDLIKSLSERANAVGFTLPDNVTLLSQEDEICCRLSQQCQNVSKQLSTALEHLKNTGDLVSTESLHDSVSNELLDQQHLCAIRKDLQESFAPLQWSSINDMIRELAAKNSRLEATRGNDIENLTSTINNSFLRLKQKELDDSRSSTIWSELLKAVQAAAEYSTEQVILSALHFWTMNRRKELISKEHENTFEWIFTENSSKSKAQPVVTFMDWLVKDEPLYWISGKPGSGKSTIVKFIAENLKTIAKLKQWAGEDKLVTASFYFWSSAKDSLQKSDAGLLRSILFQILRQCPELIRRAFPEQWQNCQSEDSRRHLAHTVSTTAELLAVYQRISNLLSTVKVKFCFFIDGLDEFEGDSVDIVHLIESLSKTPNLKACISSRPWHEFEASFGGRNPWKLYVHELTEADMKVYVEDLLERNQLLSKLRKVDGKKKVEVFVKTIVQNAEGVFLWVFLVVRSLINGLTKQDRVATLHSKLAAIPTDLETYFEQMLLNIDNQLRPQVAHTFLLTLNAVEKLSLMCYWLILEGHMDSIENSTQQPVSEEIATRRLQDMAKKLSTYSTGLLIANKFKEEATELEEYQWLFEFRVDFIHRTVADFLRTSKMQQLLAVWSAESFNVDLAICNASLATIMITPTTHIMFRDAPGVLSSLHLFLSHVKLLESSIAEVPHVALVDDFVSSLRIHHSALDDIKGMILGPGSYWSYGASFDFAILYHIASYGLGQYVSIQIDRRQMKFSEPPSGLLSGCLSLDPRVRTGKSTLNVDAIHLLLRRGLDPNLPWGDRDFSFWQQLLTTAYSKHIKGVMTYAESDAISHSVNHGVDLQASVEVFGRSRLGNARAIDILEKILSKEQFFALKL